MREARAKGEGAAAIRFLSVCVCLFLSLLSTLETSRTVQPIMATKDPLEWTGDPEAHTTRVLPSGRKGWPCIVACVDGKNGSTVPPTAATTDRLECLAFMWHLCGVIFYYR